MGYESDIFAVSCPWDNDGQTHLHDWDEWRREDDEVHIPISDQYNYGAVGQPSIYPRSNMGTHFEIVAPKPVRPWHKPISWLVHPPKSPVADDKPLPDFLFIQSGAPSADIIYSAPQGFQMEKTTSYSSSTTAYHAYAQSITVYGSEDMTKCTSISQSRASPSCYLSVVAASIMPPKMSLPPAGRWAPPMCDISRHDPDYIIYETGQAIRLERQDSRQQKMFPISCVRSFSYCAPVLGVLIVMLCRCRLIKKLLRLRD